MMEIIKVNELNEVVTKTLKHFNKMNLSKLDIFLVCDNIRQALLSESTINISKLTNTSTDTENLIKMLDKLNDLDIVLNKLKDLNERKA